MENNSTKYFLLKTPNDHKELFIHNQRRAMKKTF